MNQKMSDRLTKAITKQIMRKNLWLLEELINGLKEVGVQVRIDQEPMALNHPYMTVLHIQTADGRRHSVGMKQILQLKRRKEAKP